MLKLDITLRDKITNLTIYLKQIPQRFEMSVHNRFILWFKQVKLTVAKYIGLNRAVMVLRSMSVKLTNIVYIKASSATVLSTSPIRALLTIFIGIQGKAVLKTKAVFAVVVNILRVSLTKNRLCLLSRPINLRLVRLRKLNEMDGLVLDGFDGMKLHEIDFVDI